MSTAFTSAGTIPVEESRTWPHSAVQRGMSWSALVASQGAASLLLREYPIGSSSRRTHVRGPVIYPRRCAARPEHGRVGCSDIVHASYRSARVGVSQLQLASTLLASAA